MEPNTPPTPAQAERLHLLIEEAAEVQQIATKILRHGYLGYDGNTGTFYENNRLLEKEIGHLEVAIECLLANDDIIRDNIDDSFDEKILNLPKYTHHQAPIPIEQPFRERPHYLIMSRYIEGPVGCTDDPSIATTDNPLELVDRDKCPICIAHREGK